MSVRSCALFLTATTLAAGAQVLPASVVATSARTAAAAGETWGPIHAFERNLDGESMAVDGHNVTTVAWGSSKGWPEPVKVARRTASGQWRKPVSLGAGYEPVVATDPAGNLVMAWLRDRKGYTTGVWAARKPVGRPWTRPVHLSRDRVAPGYPAGGGGFGATALDVAVGHGGAALVTWEWGSVDRNVPFRVQAAYRAAGGQWDSQVSLSRAGATNAHAALAPDGRAWVAYQLSPAPGRRLVKVRSRTADGTWRPAHRIGTGSLGDLGVNRRGGVTVVFTSGGRVRVALKAAAGAWAASFPVTPGGVKVRVWSVSFNRGGAALVAYLSGRHQVDVVRRPVAGGWTKPKMLTVADPSLAGVFTAVGPLGDMFAGWHNYYGIWGSYRPAGQGWNPETTAQPDHGQVDVLEAIGAQVAPNGDVVLLWEQEERPLRVRVLHTP